MWRQNNKLLKGKKKSFKKEIREYVKSKENGNTTFQNV